MQTEEKINQKMKNIKSKELKQRGKNDDKRKENIEKIQVIIVYELYSKTNFPQQIVEENRGNLSK